MPMFCEITELAKELDDVIKKGLSIPEKEDLKKALTFDPFRPSSVGPDSDIYTPYKWVDNGFMPYEVDHWRNAGKDSDRDSYAEVQKLYDQINFRRSAFKSMIKNIDTDLVKAGAVPVGTVHTYQNGVKYKKIADGQWAPLKDTSKPMTGHDDIERHALGIEKVQGAIKQKTREATMTESIKEEARREAMKTVQEALKQVFGDEMPEGLSKYFGKVSQQNEMKDRETGKDPQTRLQELSKELSKPEKHTVTVEFTHNGKKFNHTFDNITGASKEEITGRIQDLVKKRIPDSVITKINTVKKEQKEKGISPKQVWKDKVKEQPQMRQ